MDDIKRLKNNIVVKYPFLLVFFAAKNPLWVFVGASPLLFYFLSQIEAINWLSIICITLGLVFWTFLEYVIHRWIYHININSRKLRFVIDGFHFYHHHIMNDRRVLNAGFLTLYLVSALILPPFYLIFNLTPQPELFYQFALGILMGNLFYEFVHFQIHYKRHSRGYLRSIQNYHLYHHQKRWNKNYGNTSSFWDRIFNTYDASFKTFKLSENVNNHFIKSEPTNMA
ncbi:MAG: 4-hydroxysphinganine ceramide fatty acyl 2-hydroxylase [Psychrosphaera sp.]|jgi:4-hydroxysphinganine ceramide fatty acyl 2-hydroxylase|uniref:sterol desaturase family protein n=1 Tax=Psychrosphaera sp. F3M07 TaxID=2841560 RepID=UPI001C09362C|nr:sterol desaturase family protein [Psychrosphaera sp. F3M07]MBU2917616.1 sterol desaturase family protein [Psychrosphaera sp. F3M07]